MPSIAPVGSVIAGAGGAAAGKARVQVWGANPSTFKDDVLRAPGSTAPSGDAAADKVYANAEKVLEYYRTTYARDGWDGKGADMRILVHASDSGNAYWVKDEQRLWFGDGDGARYGRFGDALDVVGHEFTHAVIDHEIKLDTSYGQEGALHESFSDVMATGLDGNWTIAEDIVTPGTPGDALRDLAHPVYAHMKDVRPWVTEGHALADVPNHAAYLVANKVGGDAMRQIWYHAVTKNMHNHTGFAGARQATIAAAKVMYGEKSSQYAAVRDAWEAVGITDETPKELPRSEGQLAAARMMSAVAGARGLHR